MTTIKNKHAYKIFDALKRLEASDNEFSLEALGGIANQKELFETAFDEASKRKDHLLDLYVKKNSDGTVINDVKGFVYNSVTAKQEFLSKLGEYMSQEHEYDVTEIKRKDLPDSIKTVHNISSWMLYCVEK